MQSHCNERSHFIKGLKILSITILIVFIVSIPLQFLTQNYTEENSPRPAKLYEIINPISFEEFLVIARNISQEYNVTLKLPTWMPENLKPKAVWHKMPFVAIIAYNDEDIENYDQSKINIQISSLGPITKDILNKVVNDLNKLGKKASLLEYEDVYVLIVKDIENLGIHYYYVVDIYDLNNKVEYTITVKIPLSYEDLIRIIESMEPI